MIAADQTYCRWHGQPCSLVYSPDDGGYYADPWYDRHFQGGIHPTPSDAAAEWFAYMERRARVAS